MSYVQDIKKLEEIRGRIPSIQGPEFLQQEIARALDIVNLYGYDLKGIPRELDKWNNYLVDLGIYAGFTDDPSYFENLIFNQAKADSQSIIADAEEGLTNKLQELDNITKTPVTIYYIGDVNVDYLYNPDPTFTSNVVKQEIVTDGLQDTFNEDVTNDNTKVNARVYLRGEDKDDRYRKLLSYREKKQRIKLVFDDVYDSMIITGISPTKDGSIDTLELNLTFESIYVTQLQRTNEPLEEFRQPLKEESSSGKQGTKPFDRDFYIQQQAATLEQ